MVSETWLKANAMRGRMPPRTPFKLLLWMAETGKETLQEIREDELSHVARLEGVGKKALKMIRENMGLPASPKLTPMAALRLILEMGDDVSKQIAARALADAGHQSGNTPENAPPT